jgi:hypothetical protein
MPSIQNELGNSTFYAKSSMKTIRASEVGSYLFCARAWWYQRNGNKSSNQAELSAGAELHRQHGRRVIAAGLTRSLAVILLLVALALLVAFCTARFI